MSLLGARKLSRLSAVVATRICDGSTVSASSKDSTETWSRFVEVGSVETVMGFEGAVLTQCELNHYRQVKNLNGS